MNLWSMYIAPFPRLAAALRLVTVPADLDLRPYLTLTATASPQTAAVGGAEGGPAIRFVGLGEFTGFLDVSVDQLDSLTATTRGALRQLADDRSGEDPDDEGVASRLQRQLPRLAIVGFRIYADLASGLTQEDARALAHETRTPAVIPIASRTRTTKTFPAAILYDRPIDTALPASEFVLCPAFGTALATHLNLTQTICWQGECPSAQNQEVVCASGFWGFRHAIGHPYSVAASGHDQEVSLVYEDDPDIVLGLGSDPALHPDEHVARLADLAASWPTTHWHLASERSRFIEVLEEVEPHLVYLFGRGGDQEGIPGLMIGLGESSPLQPTHLRGIHWSRRRPIVIVNSGVGGDGLGEFTRAFLAAGACGVIGMEAPIRAREAAPFAEQLISRILTGQQVGWAIRDARLDILGMGSPSALSYTGLIDPSLRLNGPAA
jgi:hypothetical protein